MKKKRLSPSFLMIFGFILLILCAIALPSAAEGARFTVIVAAVGSAGLIVSGFLLSLLRPRNSQKANDKGMEGQ